MFIDFCACEACDLLRVLLNTFTKQPVCTTLKENIHDDKNLFELERLLQARRVLQYRLDSNGELVLVDTVDNKVMEFIDLPYYLEPSQKNGLSMEEKNNPT